MYKKKGLNRKILLISNFMMSQPGKQTIVVHILSNISKSRDNKTMKFSHLIEYDIRNTFLEKSCIKCGGETKKLKFSLSLNQQSKVLHRLSLLHAKLKAIQIY